MWIEKHLEKALQVFDKRGLSLNKKIERKEFCIFVFSKKFYNIKNTVVIDNDNFIVCAGTFFYEDRTGPGILVHLHNDIWNGRSFIDKIAGNYCIITYHNGELRVFRDYFGYYPVYCNEDHTALSSSLLAIAHLTSSLNIASQELYEYLFNGYFYDENTLFKEIKLLKEGVVHNLLPSHSTYVFKPVFDKLNPGMNFRQATKKVTDNLLEYFSLLSSAFSEQIQTAISGGYDSRLILACLLNLGLKPRLYVNGTPNSPDIKCALNIAQGLDLPLDVIYFYEYYDIIKSDYEKKISERFYIFDGLGASGVFDNYSDIEYRLLFPNSGVVLLNGAGGEIYREAWNLPNRKMKIDDYIKGRYDKFDHDFCRPPFTKKIYYNQLKQKISQHLPKSNGWIARNEIELLHPLRYKAAHFIFTVLQQLNCFLMPFLEPRFVLQSYDIPIKWKHYGDFQSALVKRIYPELAKFNSIYGYNFSKPVPFKFKVKETILRNTPLTWRPKLRNYRKSRKLPVHKFGFNILEDAYLKKLFDFDQLKIDEFLDIKKISNSAILSRSLSVELLLRELEK